MRYHLQQILEGRKDFSTAITGNENASTLDKVGRTYMMSSKVSQKQEQENGYWHGEDGHGARKQRGHGSRPNKLGWEEHSILMTPAFPSAMLSHIDSTFFRPPSRLQET